MDRVEFGKQMRAWRVYVGKRRDAPLTLEAAAELIAQEAARQGFDRNARSTPCKHASLSRWEGGKVQQKTEGLGIIARAYGISFDDLIGGYPPGETTPVLRDANGQLGERQLLNRNVLGSVASSDLEDSHLRASSVVVIRDGDGLNWARHQLGWSMLEMALALRMEGPDEKLKARIHEMEIGTRNVSGPMTVAIEALLQGFRPEGFEA